MKKEKRLRRTEPISLRLSSMSWDYGKQVEGEGSSCKYMSIRGWSGIAFGQTEDRSGLGALGMKRGGHKGEG